MGMERIRVVQKSPKNLGFRNADVARKHRENQASWQELLKKHDVKHVPKTVAAKVSKGSLKQSDMQKLMALQASLGRMPMKSTSSEPPRDLTKKFEEKPTVYTGDNVLGVANLHKSTYTPVMRDCPEAAIEIANMRR